MLQFAFILLSIGCVLEYRHRRRGRVESDTVAPAGKNRTRQRRLVEPPVGEPVLELLLVAYVVAESPLKEVSLVRFVFARAFETAV